MSNENRICVVIPCYCEEKRIGDVVRGVLAHVEAVVVIDDGSDDATTEKAREAGAVAIKHEVNKGKGAALETGFAYARENGFEAVLVMDGDGQHAPEDVPAFVEAYARGDVQALVGNRMSDPKIMPLVRKLPNRSMSWLLSRQMGQRVPDTQCGFRLYACDSMPANAMASARFEAESEILLRMSAAGVKIGSVPIRVIYRDEKSKINPVVDTFRFFHMLRTWKRISQRRRER